HPSLPKAPEVLGLFLGGSVKIDPLKLRLVEPDLIIEGAASDQIIQAVGVIDLDPQTQILRFYTDDDGFIQVLQSGGKGDEYVADVKLWYFYETRSVGNDWEQVLKHNISLPEYSLDGHTFTRSWQAAGSDNPPVAMTEKTYHLEGSVSETDQFLMLYERQANENLAEYLTLAGEESLCAGTFERNLVICTGFDLSAADFTAN
ncbi:MAG TPA: YjfK family protein, partial [Cellvibrionaceae bacterium]|nr:YjfK family protein [Cellvibrionaceae bacterium]